MKQTEPSPIASRFQRLSSLFYLMVGLHLVAFSWVYLNLKFWTPRYFFQSPEGAVAGHVAIVGLTIGLAVLAIVRYRQRHQEMAPFAEGKEGVEALEKKVQLFYEASLQKYVFLTGATLLVVLGFYLSLNEFYVPLYAIALILFSINQPTAERLGRDMQLKKEEREMLNEELKQLK